MKTAAISKQDFTATRNLRPPPRILSPQNVPPVSFFSILSPFFSLPPRLARFSCSSLGFGFFFFKEDGGGAANLSRACAN